MRIDKSEADRYPTLPML